MRAQDRPNFYTSVYHVVAQIPAGQVTTYGQIARWLGHPSAARAVGYALHALPAGADLPWQRVINAAGRVSCRGDRHYEAIQRALLEAEGIRFDPYGHVDLQVFGWSGPQSGIDAQQQGASPQHAREGPARPTRPPRNNPRQGRPRSSHPRQA